MRQSQIPFLIRAFLFLFALALVAGIVRHLGADQILGHLSRVGWRICFVFFLGFPRFLLNTLAWRIFLQNQQVSLWELTQVKIAGELLTRVTPLHFLGGDTARVFLLGKADTKSRLTASVLMDRTATSLGGAFFILTGFIIGTFLLPIGLAVKWVIAGVMIAIFLGLALLISQQKKGIVGPALRTIRHWGLGRLVSHERLHSWEAKSIEVDTTLQGYYEAGHGRLLQATLLNYLGRWVAAAEILVLFWIIGIPLGPWHALMFSSISLLLSAAFFVLPGSLGVAEGTYGLFFHILKLEPVAGVSLELSRKINAILWYGFGGLLAIAFKRRGRA